MSADVHFTALMCFMRRVDTDAHPKCETVIHIKTVVWTDRFIHGPVLYSVLPC